ncbi:MAG: NifB/NifX family molybdenum-iron cluster-binding protein [Candidatus Hatepunaea meridiana]|nr:NifB/NifX family molybdenum-iron cluster-binding protein [Candidatus Hatepunaea meridiana]
MRYLIAALTPDLDAKVHRRFGGAEYYIVIDSELTELSFITGKGEDQPTHGIGRFLHMGIERVIVGNIGPNAFRQIRQVGWSMYSCHGMTVREAVEKVENGSIPPLKAPTMKVSVHSDRNKSKRKKHKDGGKGLRPRSPKIIKGVNHA